MNGDRLTKRVETINAGQARKASIFGETGKGLSALQIQRKVRTAAEQNAAVELMAERFARNQDLWTGASRRGMSDKPEIEIDEDDYEDYIERGIRAGTM